MFVFNRFCSGSVYLVENCNTSKSLCLLCILRGVTEFNQLNSCAKKKNFLIQVVLKKPKWHTK